MVEIKGLGQGTQSLELPEAKGTQKQSNFKDFLKNCIDDVNKLQKEAEKTVGEVATGKVENIHEAMIAMQKADLSFKLMVEARDRIVKAYEEVIKIKA